MNEELLKQLVRQMKIMNFWVTLFGTITIIAIIALAILIFQVVQVINKTNDQLTQVKTELAQSVDVKKQLCDGDNNLTTFLNKAGACK